MDTRVVICVDTSPRWLHGHTMRDQIDPGWERWAVILAEFSRWLHGFLVMIDEEVPIVSVESTSLDWLVVPQAHRETELILVGLYGDGCVRQIAECLSRAHRVVVARDLCVWVEREGMKDYPVPLVKAEELFPAAVRGARMYFGLPPLGDFVLEV